MAEENFVDYVKICCRSGNGGPGSLHFHREKYIAKGGPDGGDGGRGGHVILHANSNYWTLLHLRYARHSFAGHGGSGSGSRSSGKQGVDKIIEVPIGTVAYDAETGAFLCDVSEPDESVILLEGGRGGLGNWNFKTATNQAPHYAQPGEPLKEINVVLELKLLADVGLVGAPNAGKSTLLSVVSAAKPKIADYPFTTMVPNLGIVDYRDGRSFVMSDIPGIIEGAAEGKGIGLRFLRHIERNAVLLFLVPVDTDDIKKEYESLLNELNKFNPDLMDKSRYLILTKADMLDDELMSEMEDSVPDVPHMFISAVSGYHVQELKDELWKLINDDNNKVMSITHRSIEVKKDNKDVEADLLADARINSDSDSEPEKNYDSDEFNYNKKFDDDFDLG